MGDEFVTKDSGERRVFDSGMQRDVEVDKPRYDLTFNGPMLERWAWLLKRGADKYDANNWMKAAGEEELERFLSSAARHFAQWMQGDRTEDHAAAVFFNINGAEYVRDRMSSVEAPPRAYVEVAPDTFKDVTGVTFDTFVDDGLVEPTTAYEVGIDTLAVGKADPSYVQDTVMHLDPAPKDDKTGSLMVQSHSQYGMGPHYHDPKTGNVVEVEL